MVVQKRGIKLTGKMPRAGRKETAERGVMVNRRPIRPIDRQRMRPWLLNLLDGMSVPGLAWEDRTKEIFVVSWRHGAHHGWDINHDADVFCRWALHTGKFQTGDPPNPKQWKANFRCALHSLSDVKRLPSDTKGENAQRRYQLLDPSRARPKGRRAKMSDKIKREPDYTDTSDSSSSDTDSFCSNSTENPLPKFNLLLKESVSQSLKNHNSGFQVTVNPQPQMESSMLNAPYHIPRSASPESSESFTGSAHSESDFSDQEVMEIAEDMTLLEEPFSVSWLDALPDEAIEYGALEEVKTSDSPEEPSDLMVLNAMAKNNFL